MRGIIHILWADAPMDILYTARVPSIDDITRMVRGLPDIVSGYNQHVSFTGELRPAIMVINREAVVSDEPRNFIATALWHYVLRARGENPGHRELCGTVLIFTGDQEYLEQVLS